MTRTKARNVSGTRHLTRRDVLKGIGASALGFSAILRTGQAPAAARPVTLRYWTWLNSSDATNPRARAQAEILGMFRKANPDIELVEEVVPWQQIFNQLLQAAAAGKAPDVSKQLDRFVSPLAQAEAILPLEEFTASWSAGRRNDYSYSWDDTTVGGKKFAFRHAVRPVNIMYYRADLYEAAGFKTPPKTFKEFTEVSKQITKGSVLGYVEPLSKSDMLAKFILIAPPMLWVQGSDLVDQKTGKAMFHLEPGQRIFQWYQDMVYTHKVCPVGMASMDSETVNSMFVAGTTGATFDHTSKWADWSQREALRGRVETGWLPNFANEVKPVPANTAGGWTLVMAKGAKKEAAWKLMEFLQSNEAELIDARVGGELPTRKSTLTNPFFQTPQAKRMVDWLNYMAANSHPATSLRIKKLEVLLDVIGDAAQQIVVNKADIKTTLSVAAQKYDAQI
jgi:multiple sugar transport system substrate-binding protein